VVACSIEKHAAQVYQLACKLDLSELEERSKKAFRSVADLSKPFALADLIGTQRAQSIVSFFGPAFVLCRNDVCARSMRRACPSIIRKLRIS
jgi:hypothetical protein